MPAHYLVMSQRPYYLVFDRRCELLSVHPTAAKLLVPATAICGLASVNKAVVPHEIVNRSDVLLRATDIPNREVNH